MHFLCPIQLSKHWREPIAFGDSHPFIASHVFLSSIWWMDCCHYIGFTMPLCPLSPVCTKEVIMFYIFAGTFMLLWLRGIQPTRLLCFNLCQFLYIFIYSHGQFSAVSTWRRHCPPLSACCHQLVPFTRWAYLTILYELDELMWDFFVICRHANIRCLLYDTQLAQVTLLALATAKKKCGLSI